jgi:hypothetical protein
MRHIGYQIVVHATVAPIPLGGHAGTVFNIVPHWDFVSMGPMLGSLFPTAALFQVGRHRGHTLVYNTTVGVWARLNQISGERS